MVQIQLFMKDKNMIDKEWLAKVALGASVYQTQEDIDSVEVDKFVAWLYKQYGIVQEEKAHG
jgi:hypothetical protein